METTQTDRNTKDPNRETVLVLRTCKAERKSTNGFVWPESGYVEAPDWEPTTECGNGLHGWLHGEGDASLGYAELDGALGLVVETYADHIIDLEGKVKFPFGWVVYCGDLRKAAQIVSEKYPGAQVLYGTATAGDGGTATAGDRGTATAGDGGTATAGDGGTATAGDRGTATAGDGGMILIRRWNGKRYKFEMANVGENGIEPNVAYRLNDDGSFVEAA